MYGFGWVKSPPSKRNIVYSLVSPLDLSRNYVVPLLGRLPVFDQGQRGTCVANAHASMKEWQDLRDNKDFYILSREYLFDRCKENDGIPDEDGTFPKVALEVLETRGVCRDSLCPYTGPRPETPEMDGSAKFHTIRSHAAITRMVDLKAALVAHGPCTIGIPVYENFPMSPAPGLPPGEVPMPRGQLIGGHDVLVVGWNESHLIFRNSWGMAWGDRGNGTLPHGYPELFADCWTGVDLASGVTRIEAAA